MHKNASRIGMAVGTAAVLLVGLVIGNATVGTAGAAPATNCTLGSLSGNYGVKFDGDSVKLGHFASVSVWSFDGNGALNASEAFNSVNSGPKTRTVAGKYEMRRNCTFKLLFPSELAKKHDADGECVLVDSGKEFYCLDNEVGWVTTGLGKRV